MNSDSSEKDNSQTLQPMELEPTAEKYSFKPKKAGLKNSIKIKGIKAILSEKLPNTKYPWRLLKVQMPQFQMPQQFEVKLHSQSKIQYDGESKIMTIPRDQFLSYKGKIKLSVTQMQIHEYQTPDIVKKYLKSIRKVNLWVYKGKRVTNWHYDGHDNFIYQIEGRKVIYLLPPNTVKPINCFSLYNNHLDSDDKIKQYLNRIRKVIVGPNQCLFIPRGWWHYVVSHGNPSIMVNFWGNSYGDIEKDDYENLLRHLIFQIGEDACKETVENWQEMEQNLKQKYRLNQFRIFMSQRIV